MAGYLAEVSETVSTLDSRYDDLKNRAVNTLDGEAFFEDLRQRGDLLLKQQSAK